MSTEPTDLRPAAPRQGPPTGSGPSTTPDERIHDEPRRRPPNGARTPPPRRKRKARKVHRVVRHVDVWSVAKVGAIFSACAYVMSLVCGFLLWQAAERVGTIDGIEGFIESSAAYESFDILGGVVFRVAAVTGFVLAVVMMAVVVLGALLFNLISDLTGGIRMTVIDEDLIVAPARRPPS